MPAVIQEGRTKESKASVDECLGLQEGRGVECAVTLQGPPGLVSSGAGCQTLLPVSTHGLFVETDSCSVARAGVQWCNVTSRQPLSPGFKNSCASTSQEARIIGVCHEAQLIFVFLAETGFPLIGQAGFELLGSGNPPTWASQSAEITGVSHSAWSHIQFWIGLHRPFFSL
ncbi:hypothetical protein AAY473_024832 [Plecturocebus cupreus]